MHVYIDSQARFRLCSFKTDTLLFLTQKFNSLDLIVFVRYTKHMCVQNLTHVFQIFNHLVPSMLFEIQYL